MADKTRNTRNRKGTADSGTKKKVSKQELERRARKREAKKQKIVNDNPAKSIQGVSAGSRKRTYAKKQRSNKVSHTIGMILAVIQLLVSVTFMGAVFMLGMLPDKYLLILGGVLIGTLLITFLGQLLSNHKAIAGKIFSIFMSVVLGIGSFYIFKTNGTVQNISGGNVKVDKMVVAVLADDAAETIEDAASYNFGVQYALKGQDVKDTVSAINDEIGGNIMTAEYSSIQEQASALHEGEVEAIIYNEAYSGVLEDSFENFADSVKVIYTYDIESQVENEASNVKVEQEPFTVYISGIDVYGAIETNSRSDVNIMAVVNPNSHQILLVTTPRDFYVEIPGISGGSRDKLTHAGIYGVDASMETLGALYDTDIDFYARVNFTSLVQMVDALGGVDVNSEQAFTTSADSGAIVDVVQGMNHFNGEQALAFSRERMNVDGGDNQRGKNQQAVITAMIKKAISPAILMGANGILNSVSGNVDTNMSQDQIQELIKSQLNDGTSWNIKSLAAEGTGDMQYCYSGGDALLSVIWPDDASVAAIQAAIDAVENGEVFSDSEVAE